MSQHAEPSMRATETPPAPVEIPDTDNPVVLRELLRQAREQLRMRDSIEQLMADNIARTEALLAQAGSMENPRHAADPHELASAVEAVRMSLQGAMAAVDRLTTLLEPSATLQDNAQRTEVPAHAATPPATDEPRKIEVLIHNVQTPALARSVQQYLLGIEDVTNAEVRELAEGLLRITVTSNTPITGDSLAGWIPDRRRTVRTTSAGVLELELESDMP